MRDRQYMTIPNRISFSIYQANNRKKPGLKKSFIVVRDLLPGDTQVTLEDGSIWPLYYEKNTQYNPQQNWPKKWIISFQVYEDGDYFAVARVHTQRIGK